MSSENREGSGSGAGANASEHGHVRRLIPLSKFNQYHPDPTVPALRWLVQTNRDGFNRCIVRRARRILIDEQEYFRWVDEQSQQYKLKYGDVTLPTKYRYRA
jgi:hypothetical protein